MPSSQPPVWAISKLVILDCDSTLSTVEGIDELARLAETQNGSEGQQLALSIASLTKRAMEGDIPLEAVYGQRLVTVNPTQAQVQHLAKIYRETVIHDARAIIAALQALDTQVFMVSGGLIEPVRDFGIWLGITPDHIFAVDMEYDQLAGEWWRYWEQVGGQNPRANYLAVSASPLIGTLGKNRIIARIRAQYPGRALLVGDGLSDLEASSEVDLFVGFGGATFRERVAQDSDIYIHSPALSPVLPLALGQTGNTPHFAALWVDGLRRIHSGEVSFRDEQTRTNFLETVRRVSSGI